MDISLQCNSLICLLKKRVLCFNLTFRKRGIINSNKNLTLKNEHVPIIHPSLIFLKNDLFSFKIMFQQSINFFKIINEIVPFNMCHVYSQLAKLRYNDVIITLAIT